MYKSFKHGGGEVAYISWIWRAVVPTDACDRVVQDLEWALAECECYNEASIQARLAQSDRASDSYLRTHRAAGESEGCEFDPRGGLVVFWPVRRHDAAGVAMVKH